MYILLVLVLPLTLTNNRQHDEAETFAFPSQACHY